MAKLLKNLSNSLSTITPKQARLNFNLSTLIAVIILLKTAETITISKEQRLLLNKLKNSCFEKEARDFLSSLTNLQKDEQLNL